MKSKHGGALLFAIIAAFVITLIGSTIVVFTTNQYRIVDSEIDRTIALNRAQAAMEYAVYQAYTTPAWLSGGPYTVNINGKDVTITIVTPDPDGRSAYRFSITTNY